MIKIERFAPGSGDGYAGTVSFFGIVIGVFPRDHAPAHFHAVYGEYQITVEIESGVVRGSFPKRALRLVLEWHEQHQVELLDAWVAIQAGQFPNNIEPLE